MMSTELQLMWLRGFGGEDYNVEC